MINAVPGDNAEVVLETVYDDSGELVGHITASRETVLSMQGLADDELERLGWKKYREIINSVR